MDAKRNRDIIDEACGMDTPGNRGSEIGRSGHNRIDYHLTYNMANKLGLVEGTAAGGSCRSDSSEVALATLGLRETALPERVPSRAPSLETMATRAAGGPQRSLDG